MKTTLGSQLKVNDVVIVNGVRFKKLPNMLGGMLIDIDFNGTGSPKKIEVEREMEYHHISSVEFEMVRTRITGPRCNMVLSVPKGTTINH